MKASLASSIMLAVAVASFFAVLMYRYWGWLGTALYLAYAALCFAPTATQAYRMWKGGKR